MSKKYSYDDMEKLSQKIEKIKKKKNLEDIRDIIINNNKKLNITENSYGIYLCFNKLSIETFIKLEKYIKKYNDSEKNTMSASSFNMPYSSTNENIDTKYSTNDFLYEQNSRLKFSNKEKNLIKKRLYDRALKINSEVNEYEKNCLNITSSQEDIIDTPKETIQQNTIFLKKTKKVDKK
jgi:hypothetical protein